MKAVNGQYVHAMLPIPIRQTHAAVSTFVTLIYHTLHASPDPVEKALEKAQFEDEVLGGKIKKALAMENEGMDR